MFIITPKNPTNEIIGINAEPTTFVVESRVGPQGPKGNPAADFRGYLFLPGLVDSNSTILYIRIGFSAFFESNMFGSSADAKIAGTGSSVFSFRKNGIQFGTLTFPPSSFEGVFNGTSTSFSASDILSVVTPTTRDSTLADIGINIFALRT